MSWVDEKYIGIVSARLEKFKKVREGLYNFRCPICGDSTSNKNKARGYFYEKGTGYRYHCHNCNSHFSLGKFLKVVDKSLSKEYYIEALGRGKPTQGVQTSKSNERKETNNNKEKRLLDMLLPRLDTLPEAHPARVYLAKRKLPDEAYRQMYFIDDISRIAELAPSYKDRITSKEPRIVIPAYTREGHIVGLTCRAIDSHHLRYIAIQISARFIPIFGLDVCDLNTKIHVVEGPIDRFFIDNCLAVGTSSLISKCRAIIHKDRDILIWDNQPRNPEIVGMVRKALINGYNAVIWPRSIDEKDLNEMHLAGRDVKSLVAENIKRGPAGLTAWDLWRKI